MSRTSRARAEGERLAQEAEATMASTLARPLVFVTGKGGTGKSTVAAALACAWVRAGRRVRLLVTRPDDARCEHAEIVDGTAALAEYLGRALPERMARRVTGSRLYRRFVAAAPGLRELMALGKILDEARGGEWDTVVADGPATGQIIQALRMPAVASGVFGGLVRREAERLAAELTDPGHTRFVVVAVPEALAIDETVELVRALAGLGVPVGPVVMNRVHRAPFPPEAVPLPSPSTTSLVAAALQAGRDQAQRAALDRRHVARLRAEVGVVRELPELLAEEVGRVELEGLGGVLLEEAA